MSVLFGSLFALLPTKILFNDGDFTYVSERDKAGAEPYRPRGAVEVISFPFFFVFWLGLFVGLPIWLLTR